jgi:U3 small nucleolar RNA-associated protein 7
MAGARERRRQRKEHPGPGSRISSPSSSSPGMDSLFAKAKALDGQKRGARAGSSSRRKLGDRTAASIAHRSAVPKSLQDAPAPDDAPKAYGHIANAKLRSTLQRQGAQAARARALADDAALLKLGGAGLLQAEDALERTWRVPQDTLVGGAGAEAGKGRREWRLDGGPYRCRSTRTGRCAPDAGGRARGR